MKSCPKCIQLARIYLVFGFYLIFIKRRKELLVSAKLFSVSKTGSACNLMRLETSLTDMLKIGMGDVVEKKSRNNRAPGERAAANGTNSNANNNRGRM